MATEVEQNSLPDAQSGTVDDAQLRRSWLRLLPVEQVIEIVFKLSEHVPEGIQRSVWPSDLSTAVQALSASESRDSGQIVVLSANVKQNGETSSNDPQTVVNVEKQIDPQLIASEHPTATATPSSVSTNEQAQPPMTIPLPHSQPPPIGPPGATPYYPPFAYLPYPPPSGQPPFPYPYPPGQHPPSQQGQANTPLFTSAPLARNIHGPGPPNMPQRFSPPKPEADMDDLPSYEDMIVQALLHFSDPEGTPPKQLFAWMASRYPLQQNFRPSASQALQKAYKRGRFEKSKDGKYRLNAAWGGGNTSKRTTRRPQSQAQVAANPQSAVHASPYAPFWPYAPGVPHPTPPPSGAPVSVPVMQDLNDQSQTKDRLPGSEAGDVGSAEEALAAAHSILQALNITALLQQAQAESNAEMEQSQSQSAPESEQAEQSTSPGTALLQNKDNTEIGSLEVAPAVVQPPTATTQVAPVAVANPNPNNFPMPIFAGDSSFPIFGSTSRPESSTVVSNTIVPVASSQQHGLTFPTLKNQSQPSSALGSSGYSQGRAALQGSLALLAAQLADIAGANVGGATLESAGMLQIPAVT